MIGYAVKPDGAWRCVDADTMQLDADETFQESEPRVLDITPDQP